MIARDTGGGRSFVGAGLYYLHDKDAATSNRVAFTHTDNLLTNDAEKAMKVMAWTAMHQSDLKASAGVKATGRKLTKPVHTFVFSWAIEEEPEQTHMIESAQAGIAKLGLADHEAVYIGHNDTDHRHIHVIVNRVHPSEGKAAKLSNSHLKLSDWAEAYEKEHGIHCHQRIENNKRRKGGEFVLDMDSRRRNAEQFSDWREDRKESVVAVNEQRRFREWADRKKTTLDQQKADRKRRMDEAQAARKELATSQFERRFDVSGATAKLEAVEQALSVRGVKSFLNRLTGRRARDMASKDALEKTIAATNTKHQTAVQQLKNRMDEERSEFLAMERERAQALSMRIENARKRREDEGWKSYKTERAREFSVAVEQDNKREKSALADPGAGMAHDTARSRGPGKEM